MRKVLMFNLVTLDGFFEGPKKWDIGWHQVDEEFNNFAIQQLNQVGGLIFGRVTYEGMADYWKSPAADEDDPIVAHKMNSLPKFVFSNTLKAVDWNNSTLLVRDAAEELLKLKQMDGKDLLILGSADLVDTFIKQNLIDEYRLLVNPIILGRGGPLFKGNDAPTKLKLVNTRSFQNGNVLLTYSPNGAERIKMELS